MSPLKMEMHLKQVSLFLFLFFLQLSLSAQNDTKIDRKLKKLFDNGEYGKCYKKAVKLNRKSPRSFVPEYYISKIGLRKYSSVDISDNNKFKHLENSVRYSSKLPESYIDWKSTVKDSLKAYIYTMHDSAQISKSCKKAVILYTRTYRDTLCVYTFYFPSAKPIEESEQLFSNSKSDSLRKLLVKFAEKQEGITYKYAGEKPETGFDCSGFTKYVYGHIGIELPHNAHLQSNLEGNNKTLSDAKAGDLIFFGSENKNSHKTQHTGIIYSVMDGEIVVIHCVSRGVCIEGDGSSWEHYWKEKVLFVKTLPSLN